MHAHLPALAPLLAGCAPTPGEEAPRPPFGEIWGQVDAEDLDPADDVVEVHLRAAPTTVSWVDGGTTQAWAYNDLVPGPLIHARVGDTVRVVLENALPEATTIHWHGLRISDEMDGVPAIQAPVEPGETFTYAFVVPDAGTFWYHPHVRAHEQIERGLQGMLIVDEADPVPVAAERGFVLDDASITSDGRWTSFSVDTNHMLQMHGRYGNVLLANGRAELATGSIRPKAIERWRIVNTANARTMWIDVTGAQWRVIGVDGGLLQRPFGRRALELPVGRRFDLEVMPRDGEETVQLRVLVPASSTTFDEYPVFEAVVEGEPGDGMHPSWSGPGAVEPGDAAQDIRLDFDVAGGGMRVDWTINGTTYADHEPIRATGNVPTLIHVRELSGADHPFHLHGQFFEVIERNGVAADEPGLYDTVLLHGDDELLLYTRLDNPGRWMTHCHILEHAERGMMTELVVE
jgi:FtsP/CotA-like multicopper oxidase with cupredoxin domain